MTAEAKRKANEARAEKLAGNDNAAAQRQPKNSGASNEARPFQPRRSNKVTSKVASIIAREAEVRGGELLRGMQLKKTDRGGGKTAIDSGKKRPTNSPLRSLGLTAAESKVMRAAR